MGCHPSHEIRVSIDASSYDEICDLCGATDGIFGGESLSRPCPNRKDEGGADEPILTPSGDVGSAGVREEAGPKQ